MSRLLSPLFRTAPHTSRREALRLLSLAGLTAILPGTNFPTLEQTKEIYKKVEVRPVL